MLFAQLTGSPTMESAKRTSFHLSDFSVLRSALFFPHCTKFSCWCSQTNDFRVSKINKFKHEDQTSHGYFFFVVLDFWMRKNSNNNQIVYLQLA